VLSNGLVNQISQRIPNIDAASIVAAGATGIRNLVSADQLPLVLEAYNQAVRNVFIIAVVTGCCGFIISFFFEWKSIKGKNLAAGLA
jgi:ABC-type sulfate transport system permease component